MKIDTETRFLRCFIPVTETGCWLWEKSINNGGYGNFFWNGKIEKAHRVAWTLFKGPIESGLCVLHKCDVRCCVNPQHLFLGTYLDNHIDMIQKGRDKHGLGENAANVKLTWNQVLEIRTLIGTITKKQLARTYGVSDTLIRLIGKNKIWKMAEGI